MSSSWWVHIVIELSSINQAFFPFMTSKCEAVVEKSFLYMMHPTFLLLIQDREDQVWTLLLNYLSFFIDLILTFNIFLLGQCHTYFSILQMDLFRQTNIFFLNIIAWGDGGKQRLPPPTSKTSEHHCKTKECSDNYAKKLYMNENGVGKE